MPRFISKICNVFTKHYDLVMLLILSLIVFVSKTPIISSTPKLTRGAVKHGPLFSKSSIVIDYPSGDLNSAIRDQSETDFLVVYFYAPWDAQSHKFSSIFERVSEVFRDEVSFVAVNCWEPSGSCASGTSFTRFPTIAVYVRGLLPIVYDGPLRADYVTDFLHRAFRPLHVIRTYENVTNLFARYDNIVVGYFNFSVETHPPGFFQFYAASMKLLSKSIASKHTVMGVVIGDKMARELNFTSSGNIAILRLNNSTVHAAWKPLPYKCSDIWELLRTPGNLQAPAVMWLQPNRVKSRHLDNALSIGPATILFLRHNPLTSLNHEVTKLRELALVYRACAPLVFRPHRLHSRARRTEELATWRRWRGVCRQWRQVLNSVVPAGRARAPWTRDPCCSAAFTRASNRCSVCEPDPGGVCPTELSACYGLRFGKGGPAPGPATCQRSEPPPGSAHWRQQCSVRQRRTIRAQAVRLWYIAEGRARPNDEAEATERPPRASRPLGLDPRERQVAQRCRRMELAEEVGGQRELPVEPPEGLDDPAVASKVESTIGGLACRANRSLHFFAVDDGLYPALTQRLGLNTTGAAETLTVLDWKNEAVFSMEEDFRYVNAANFVSKFHTSHLMPVRRSETRVTSFMTSSSVIPDFTSQTAYQTVRRNEKDIVALYYYPSCGFCSMFMHKFRNLAQYFSNQDSILFTRINVADNDLPWEWQVENLPAIILYPAVGTGRHPVVLNLNRHITLAELVHFVLRSSSSQALLKVISHVCGDTCLSANRERLSDHLVELEESKQISLSLLETAAKRLNYLNSKFIGLQKFKFAVRDWLDWAGWSREAQVVTRELRLLINFYNHRSSKLDDYVQKITAISRIIERLNADWKRPETLWNDIIAEAKHNTLHSTQ